MPEYFFNRHPVSMPQDFQGILSSRPLGEISYIVKPQKQISPSLCFVEMTFEIYFRVYCHLDQRERSLI